MATDTPTDTIARTDTTARHLVELYDVTRRIDAQINAIMDGGLRTITVKISTNSGVTEIDIHPEKECGDIIRRTARAALLVERNLRTEGIKRMGFDVPEAP